jgi:hypothetical protein
VARAEYKLLGPEFEHMRGAMEMAESAKEDEMVRGACVFVRGACVFVRGGRVCVPVYVAGRRDGDGGVGHVVTQGAARAADAEVWWCGV